jgi:polysaccharide biosynthesis/export protein
LDLPVKVRIAFRKICRQWSLTETSQCHKPNIKHFRQTTQWATAHSSPRAYNLGPRAVLYSSEVSAVIQLQHVYLETGENAERTLLAGVGFVVRQSQPEFSVPSRRLSELMRCSGFEYRWLCAVSIILGSTGMLLATAAPPQERAPADIPGTQTSPAPALPADTTQDYNQRLEKLRQQFSDQVRDRQAGDYRIGPQDLLEINIFEAPELNRNVRVSENGEVSLPLLGGIRVVQLTARELENNLAARLREFLKDPHVSVMVREIESHPISVIGEVNKPGVFQVRGSKTLLEMLSMAQGLAPEAGDEVLVMRSAGFRREATNSIAGGDDQGAPAVATNDSSKRNSDEQANSDTVAINLRHLLNSRDPKFNVPVYAGDIVKVTRAGIVYVVGAVKRPGGFTVKGSEQMSLLKAIALAEGLSSTSSKGRTRVIRTEEASGKRTEIPVDVGKILEGKSPDMNLQAADIVFIPNSAGKTALYKGTEAIVATASGLVIFHP